MLLPFVVLIAVPTIILYAVHGSLTEMIATPSDVKFWVALPIALAGIVMAIWTMLLFIRFGDGTAAPWDPPQKFVVRGPYRHVRNPMITGVIFLLLAEFLIFGSPALAIWFGIFTLGNAVYIPRFEEPGLIKRFGNDYLQYKQHVPRWMPRLRPWTSPIQD